MISIDERFKDASPINTVDGIQNILKKCGLSVTESWSESGINNCYSLRVTIDGTGLGSNGKGVTKELSRASGYAELMERLQACQLVQVDDAAFNDGKYVSYDDLSNNCFHVFNAIAGSINEISDKSVTAEQLIHKAISVSNYGKQTFAVPYYDVINRNYAYLPCGFVQKMYVTNGLAAGNSLEEAIVQGFSEIVERYSLKMIFKHRLTPPTVPDDILRRYKTAYGIITQIQAAGYDVVIKDCSLGNGYPVVASVFLDKKTHAYHVHLGSSPVFEIALERSLTEMFQGRNILAAANVYDIFGSDSNRLMIKHMNQARQNGKGAFPCEFFLDEESYPLINPRDHGSSTNTDLLNDVLEFVKSKNASLLVRDLSHLGFHTYRIIVPGFSEAYYTSESFVADFPYYEISREIAPIRMDLKKGSIVHMHMLRNFFNFIKQTNNIAVTYSFLANMPITTGATDRFLGYVFLAYIEWECNNMQGVCNYIKHAIKIAPTQYTADYLSTIYRTQEMLEHGYEVKEIFQVLCNFFEEAVINDLRSVYTSKQNPFARFIASCDSKSCSTCEYQGTCTIIARKNLRDTLTEYVRGFDNSTAFNKIHSLFEKFVE